MRASGTFALIAELYEHGADPLLSNGDTPPTWCISFGTAPPSASSTLRLTERGVIMTGFIQYSTAL